MNTQQKFLPQTVHLHELQRILYLVVIVMQCVLHMDIALMLHIRVTIESVGTLDVTLRQVGAVQLSSKSLCTLNSSNTVYMLNNYIFVRLISFRLFEALRNAA